jgi:D-alanyl-D-alanine carboxypeptidase (penicillin-binding protein 5/6)
VSTLLAVTYRGHAKLAAVVGALALTIPLIAAPALADPTPTPAPALSQTPAPGQGPRLTADGKPVCAIRDLTHVPLPRTTTMPARKTGQPVVGGEALGTDGLVGPPGSPPLPTSLAATSWLVADLDTGEVLAACGAHRYGIPASVQKVLLSATVLPKLDPKTLVEITDEDVNGWGQDANASSIWMRPGEVYPVQELFLGLLLRSGNDAANALARAAGGSRGVAGTIADMNALAHGLGAWDTHAATPSGLDPYQLPAGLQDQDQVTSAYDLALIFREAFKYKDFRDYLMTPSVHLDAQPQTGREARQYETLVKFNQTYPDAIGGKTGYTELARHSFVGARQRDGRRLVASVLGAEKIPADNNGFKQAGALLDWAFTLPRGAPVGRLVAPGEADALVATKTPPRGPVVVVPSNGSRPSSLLLTAGGAAALAVLIGATSAGLIWRRRRIVGAGGPPAVEDAAEPEAAKPEDETG